MSDQQRNGALVPPQPRVLSQIKRIPLQPVRRTDSERSFGRALQSKANNAPERNIIYSKPNPHERLWNPSPSKRARGREREVIDYNYDKENEFNEASERNHVSQKIKKESVESLENLRNRYLEKPCNEPVKNVPSTSTSSVSDLNSSFTEKISNLEIGLNNESPCAPRKPWNEQNDPEYPYITEILNYWHELEMNYRVNPNYMSRQKEISHKMRTILIDWLAEVTDECGMCVSTFHRCVQFVDRFLSKSQISRNNLQLLGTACLFVACKIEEIHPPETGDLVYLTDNTYCKTQLLWMECEVISKLDYVLMVPTSYEFTDYFSSCLEMSPTAKSFTTYVIDLSVLYGDKFLRFNASVLAAAACYVSVRCCGDSYFKETNIRAILSRIKRLQPNTDFYRNVEQAVSIMFGVLMAVGSEKDIGNSICNRYKQFQDQKYFVAAATCAACFSLPWYNVDLTTSSS